MRPALVTGATGFLGWHVARKLLDRGERVRVLARDPAKLRELEAESVAGDLRDPGSVAAAVQGCSVVYHVAADYRLWSRNPDELYRSNVDGTRNILAAAKAAGVERVVYTSTVGCIGIPAGGLGDETVPVALTDMTGTYKRSKFLAETVALEYAREGFPVVIVNPTAPIGDHDFKPTPTGKIVLDYLLGKMPAYVDTGLNVVDAGDTAQGHLLACDRGRTGERYILGSENLTLQQIFAKLEAISDVKAPAVRIPYSVAYAVATVSTMWSDISGTEPRAPIEGVRMAAKKMWVSHAKATGELGFHPGPADAALRRAVEWFRTNRYV
ncbi:MAG TPA: hopanoid-associated sugar epimerase [Bryobacteraceae bacterium]|nr:hopanoid-associated sugar epimerase [Bryobacteraceae bacterium]